MSAAALQIRGETLLLLPDRAVIWPRLRAAIVADTHFGKSGVFGRNGVAVPAGTDAGDRTRLNRLMAAHDIRRLIVLGDFLHAPLDAGSQEALDMETWSASLAGIHVQVIAGNHDRGITRGWRGNIDWIAHEQIELPFRFVHDDCQSRSAAGGAAFSLSGHLHPVVSLKGLRKGSARVPVFWLREQGLVLPSFGLFTGGQLITPASGERVFAVSPENVVAFPARQTSRPDGGQPAGGGSGT
jgi:DNA ligase-associated metallophosphoesterase